VEQCFVRFTLLLLIFITVATSCWVSCFSILSTMFSIYKRHISNLVMTPNTFSLVIFCYEGVLRKINTIPVPYCFKVMFKNLPLSQDQDLCFQEEKLLFFFDGILGWAWRWWWRWRIWWCWGWTRQGERGWLYLYGLYNWCRGYTQEMLQTVAVYEHSSWRKVYTFILVKSFQFFAVNRLGRHLPL
jgi:hypothetical protein